MPGERTVRIFPLNCGLYTQIGDNHKAITACSGPLQTRRIDRDLIYQAWGSCNNRGADDTTLHPKFRHKDVLSGCGRFKRGQWTNIPTTYMGDLDQRPVCARALPNCTEKESICTRLE